VAGAAASLGAWAGAPDAIAAREVVDVTRIAWRPTGKVAVAFVRRRFGNAGRRTLLAGVVRAAAQRRLAHSMQDVESGAAASRRGAIGAPQSSQRP
jgi:hypothetical protein